MKSMVICIAAVFFFASYPKAACNDLSVYNKYWFTMLGRYEEGDLGNNPFKTEKSQIIKKISSEIVSVSVKNSVPTESSKHYVSKLSTYSEEFHFLNYEYDPDTMTLSESYYDESGEIRYIWKRSFDARMRLVQVTFNMLRPRKMESTTKYYYDEDEQSMTYEVQDEKGNSKTLEIFNNFGYLSKYVYADGARTKNEYLYSYDNKGNISDEKWIIAGQLYKHREYSYGDNSTTRAERDAAGNIVESIRALFENDRLIREEMLISGISMKTFYEYDSRGNLIRQKGAKYEKTYQYDDKNRMIQATFDTVKTFWRYLDDNTIVEVYSLADYAGYCKKIKKEGELIFLETGKYLRGKDSYIPEKRVYVSIEYLN